MTLSRALFSFDGRATRAAFWLLVAVSSIVVYLPAFVMEGQMSDDVVFYYVSGMTLLIMWPSLAIQVKRWHDLGLSGWWVLLNLIPFIGVLAFIYAGFFDGTIGPNEYGEDPRGRLPTSPE